MGRQGRAGGRTLNRLDERQPLWASGRDYPAQNCGRIRISDGGTEAADEPM
jgi:hypothetical protein